MKRNPSLPNSRRRRREVILFLSLNSCFGSWREELTLSIYRQHSFSEFFNNIRQKWTFESSATFPFTADSAALTSSVSEE